MPLGKVRSNFNFNLDSKRVLNFENVVTDDDNVKQVGRGGREGLATQTPNPAGWACWHADTEPCHKQCAGLAIAGV